MEGDSGVESIGIKLTEMENEIPHPASYNCANHRYI